MEIQCPTAKKEYPIFKFDPWLFLVGYWMFRCPKDPGKTQRPNVTSAAPLNTEYPSRHTEHCPLNTAY